MNAALAHFVVPAEAGIQFWLAEWNRRNWAPACAGMTKHEATRYS